MHQSDTWWKDNMLNAKRNFKLTPHIGQRYRKRKNNNQQLHSRSQQYIRKLIQKPISYKAPLRRPARLSRLQAGDLSLGLQSPCSGNTASLRHKCNFQTMQRTLSVVHLPFINTRFLRIYINPRCQVSYIPNLQVR